MVAMTNGTPITYGSRMVAIRLKVTLAARELLSKSLGLTWNIIKTVYVGSYYDKDDDYWNDYWNDAKYGKNDDYWDQWDTFTNQQWEDYFDATVTTDSGNKNYDFWDWQVDGEDMVWVEEPPEGKLNSVHYSPLAKLLAQKTIKEKCVLTICTAVVVVMEMKLFLKTGSQKVLISSVLRSLKMIWSTN